MMFRRYIALRRWLSVLLMFLAGAVPAMMDGKSPQAIVTHGVLYGFFALGLMSLPLLFRQQDGREPNLLAKLEYALAYGVMILAFALGNSFDASDAEYKTRLVRVCMLLGALFLIWAGYTIWRRRPHQNVTNL